MVLEKFLSLVAEIPFSHETFVGEECVLYLVLLLHWENHIHPNELNSSPDLRFRSEII